MKGISEWFQDAAARTPRSPAEEAVSRLGLALAGGFVVAGVYVLGIGRRREETATLPTTLVLLTIVIAMVTLVIGNNMARAFGLVGALSIVRFRTVVEDTRDTAFVIFAVVVGMAIGAGYPDAGGPRRAGRPDRRPAHALGEQPAGPCGRRTGHAHGPRRPRDRPGGVAGPDLRPTTGGRPATNTSTAKQGAALEATYKVRLRSPARRSPWCPS